MSGRGPGFGMYVKDVLQDQIYRVQRIAAPVSLVLLTTNLSLTLYAMVAWRDVNPYLATSVIFLLLGASIMVIANLNILWLRMHVNERRTQVKHNPTAIYSFLPREIMVHRTIFIPLLQAVGRVEEADKLRKWNELGYIPKEDFGEDLIEYYRDPGGRT